MSKESKFTNAKKNSIDDTADEEIDEYIKKHLEDDQPRKEPSTPSESEESMGLSPRQSLLNALLKLSEPVGEDNKYSLTDRETFIFDLESILKVLTFKETCLLIFPCLEIYAVEQEYLRVELFRQLPHVFSKIMKSNGQLNGETLTTDQLMDILTVNLFPLISQLLMISEESVQEEGIKCLLKVCKDEVMPKEDAQFLMQNVLMILLKKSQDLESARIGALMMLETMLKESVFGAEVV